MVLVPVIGANMMELKAGGFTAGGNIRRCCDPAGFVAAFISGFFACKWMINLVKKGNLGWFALYCVCAGIFSILLGTHVI